MANKQLQVIDLTSETFEFAAGSFSIAGFTDKSGKQWFAAKVVCENLELGNVSQALSSLPDKEKAIIIINRDNDNRGVRHLMVTMPGVFRLIFKSRTEFAGLYQDWVFNDVLPAIQNQGGYISPDASTAQLQVLTERIYILANDKEQLLLANAELDTDLSNAKREIRVLAAQINDEIVYQDEDQS